MTRRIQKSVGPSVCPFVTLTKAYSIIDTRKIIRISSERVWHPLQENKPISKIAFSKILELIFEKLRICTKMPAPFTLLTVE